MGDEMTYQKWEGCWCGSRIEALGDEQSVLNACKQFRSDHKHREADMTDTENSTQTWQFGAQEQAERGDRMRVEALSQAVRYVMGESATSDAIRPLADTFLAFLRGDPKPAETVTNACAPDPYFIPGNADVEHLLSLFDHAHLPEHLANIVKPIQGLANIMAMSLQPGPELLYALRKLVEAKDGLVRQAVNDHDQ